MNLIFLDLYLRLFACFASLSFKLSCYELGWLVSVFARSEVRQMADADRFPYLMKIVWAEHRKLSGSHRRSLSSAHDRLLKLIIFLHHFDRHQIKDAPIFIIWLEPQKFMSAFRYEKPTTHNSDIYYNISQSENTSANCKWRRRHYRVKIYVCLLKYSAVLFICCWYSLSLLSNDYCCRCCCCWCCSIHHHE